MADKRGFTLIEVMVALAILSGVVATLLGSFNYHLGAAARGREEVLSTIMGLEKLEEIRRQGSAPAMEGVFGALLEGYRWSLVREDSELKEVKRIELKVSRPDGTGFSFVSFALEE